MKYNILVKHINEKAYTINNFEVFGLHHLIEVLEDHCTAKEIIIRRGE